MRLNQKGQGAMEYLMTYGWAILVVIIVGIVLWQSGVFGTGSGGVSGFQDVRVRDWSWSASGNFSAVYENTAGETMRTVSITYSGDINGTDDAPDPINNGEAADIWQIGEEHNSIIEDSCAAEGLGYKIDARITFTGETGLTHVETGTFRDECEA